jgi:hypothetical protein
MLLSASFNAEHAVFDLKQGSLPVLSLPGAGCWTRRSHIEFSRRVHRRFHDPTGVSVWTNSSSVAAFSQWSANQVNSGSTTPRVPSALVDEHDPSACTVFTATGPVLLPTLVTPTFAQGKRIRFVLSSFSLSSGGRFVAISLSTTILTLSSSTSQICHLRV